MKNKRTLFMSLCMLLVILINTIAFAHSGRTDSSGGHRDNKNKSGLGYYHYHCGGHPPHLHNGGVCPYKSGTTTTSQKTYSTPKSVYATSVEVSNMPSTIKIGESVKLNASAYPSNAEDNTILWESSDTSVAIVDSNGNLATVGIGTVTISAKTSRGTTSEYDLTVEAIEAESIEIYAIDNETRGRCENLEFEVGDKIELQAIVLPENTTDASIEWMVDNTEIAKVDKNGMLTMLSPGKVVVTAKTTNENVDEIEIEISKTTNYINAVILLIVFGGVITIVFLVNRRRKLNS